MHVCMFFNHRSRVEPWPELAQSIDQALHQTALLVSALLIASL